MTYVIFDIFKRNVWGAILMERPTNNLDFNSCGHRKMLPQLQLYRFSKSKRGRKYSKVIITIYVKNDHASKMLFSHHIKISFGTEGLTTFFFDCGHFWVILNVHAHSDYPSSKFIHCWASRDLHVISVQFGIIF